MDLAEEKVAAISGVDDEELEEEEEEEEVEEEEEEEAEAKKGTMIGNLDSAKQETSQGVNGSSSSDSGKIFVGGVAWETTEESFAKHFGKYGEITDCVIMKDKHTQKPRGFGFVTFADTSVIDKVLEDEHVIDGRSVEVKRTVPRDESSKWGPKTKKIFVGGIPPSFTEDELKEHFSSYGKVVDHKIMVDHTSGRSRGFGFVTFESDDTVDKIVSKGSMHDLGGKQVEIKKAEPKKPGVDALVSNGRAAAGYGAESVNIYGFGGNASAYGYRSSSGFYYGGRGSANTGGYGQGYGYGYGGAAGYATFGGPIYGAGAGYGYGYGIGGYNGGFGGVGGQGYGRYHPYGR